MKKLKAIVLGYGQRGERYCDYAVEKPNELEIVAVAEANPQILKKAQKKHNIPDEYAFDDWKKLASLDKMADFAIISTQDRMHLEPALALIEKGYDLLLEKPMSPFPEECKAITKAAEKKGVNVVVCHVLRFSPFWLKVKEIVDSGKIGKIMSVIHMENVGILNNSHSYIRGNWRITADSSPMILAKSCHDTDILQWIIGKECKKVQSFGSRTHFTPENKPEGAPDRCTDGCPYHDTCPYNAIKTYYDYREDPVRRQTVTGIVNPTDEQVWHGLETGLYGRCVYACDNDVVDHQVVNMEFEDGCTVSFTMNGFNKGGRFIRIFGTKGELEGDMGACTIKVFDFSSGETQELDTEKIGQHIESGHGGGDRGIMVDTVRYFAGEEQSKSICDVRLSYISHIIAFAAEESRLTGKVIDIDEYSESL